MIKRKTFFSFGHYVQYAMVTKQDIWFLLNRYFDYATIMREMVFFYFTGTFTMELSSYMTYIAHGITNLSKKIPNGILPGKNMCNLKKLSSSGISVDSYMIYFPQNCQITDVFKKTDKLLVLLSCSLYLSDFILQSLWGFNNIFFDYERLIS